MNAHGTIMRKVPVLIIGGGPVGLALASDHGWRGITCVLVEKGDGTIVTPKMKGVNVRTMEFCGRWAAAVHACPFPPDWRGFIPLRFGPDAPNGSALETAALNRGVPLKRVAISDPNAAQLYERRLVLVRPDGHVAWRGDNLPADAASLIEAVRGAAA